MTGSGLSHSLFCHSDIYIAFSYLFTLIPQTCLTVLEGYFPESLLWNLWLSAVFSLFPALINIHFSSNRKKVIRNNITYPPDASSFTNFCVAKSSTASVVYLVNVISGCSSDGLGLETYSQRVWFQVTLSICAKKTTVTGWIWPALLVALRMWQRGFRKERITGLEFGQKTSLEPANPPIPTLSLPKIRTVTETI